MAAGWVVLTAFGGVVIGGGLVLGLLSWRVKMEQRVEDRLRDMMKPVSTDGAMLDRVLERLLEAVVPTRDLAVGDMEPEQRSDAEYEPPDVEVGDWTDPFIGLERPLVARLAPGQQIPGFAPDDDRPVDPVEVWQESGEAGFEEWMRDTMMPDGQQVTGWVEPLDLEGDHGG